MLQAREKFDNVAIGDKKARAEYEAELTANIDESANRLQRENEEVAVRANEHWLQRKWEDGVEERMKRCREQNQDGALPKEAIQEIESFLCTFVADVRVAYSREAVGPLSSHDGPFE